MAKYMLDTDICIYYRSGRSERVTHRLAALQAGEAVMSVITYGELRLGAEKSVDPKRAFQLLKQILMVAPAQPLEAEAAIEYASIRADLERRGEVIGSNDLWIAAHARVTGLTLVTNNEREFRRVPGLAVENWAAETQ